MRILEKQAFNGLISKSLWLQNHQSLPEVRVICIHGLEYLLHGEGLAHLTPQVWHYALHRVGSHEILGDLNVNKE